MLQIKDYFYVVTLPIGIGHANKNHSTNGSNMNSIHALRTKQLHLYYDLREYH